MGEHGAARPHVAMTTEPYMTEGARKMARKLAWSLIVLFVVTIMIGGVNLLFTASQVNNAHEQTLAACSFWKDLAALPVQNAPGTRYPSELAVTLVAHSRQAYRGTGCPGKLPPPSASFVRGARHFGIDPS